MIPESLSLITVLRDLTAQDNGIAALGWALNLAQYLESSLSPPRTDKTYQT